MLDCKFFVNLIKKSFTKRHWRNGFFLNDDFRMFLEKDHIVKSNMADNTKAVCNNTDFVGIAKVAVNEELLYLRTGSGMG